MIFEFTFAPPKIGVGKAKNQYATTNNIPHWVRFHKTKIKNTFKSMLCSWYIPSAEQVFNKATVTFQVLRDSKRKIDADAFSSSAYKWTIDTLVQQGYLKDDDKVRIILEPAILNASDNETQIHCKVELYND